MARTLPKPPGIAFIRSIPGEIEETIEVTTLYGLLMFIRVKSWFWWLDHVRSKWFMIFRAFPRFDEFYHATALPPPDLSPACGSVLWVSWVQRVKIYTSSLLSEPHALDSSSFGQMPKLNRYIYLYMYIYILWMDHKGSSSTTMVTPSPSNANSCLFSSASDAQGQNDHLEQWKCSCRCIQRKDADHSNV